jgi:LacI family transcriptional regulator
LADNPHVQETGSEHELPSSPSRVGIVQLAESLGLSVSTVSRALNGYSDVSPATRARIEDAAARLGYKPNAKALKLRLGRTHTIAFVLSPSQRQYADPFYIPLLTSLDESLAALGLDLMVTASRSGEQELEVFQRLVEGERADGIVFSRTRPDDVRVRYCLARQFPFVTLGRSNTLRPYSWVDVDHGARGYHAARTLIDLGHRSLVLLNTSSRYNYSRNCADGFRKAVDEASAAVSARVIDGGMTEESGDRLGRELLAAVPPPTAFVCGNDAMALGVMHAASELGLVVGRDVSVIGSNDVPIARFVSPGLSSYAAPIEEVGGALVKLLHRQMTGHAAEPQSMMFDPVFMARGSHGRAPE